jgi:ABC-type dipeptide/oligopeptide/nickel transport system permease subunit
MGVSATELAEAPVGVQEAPEGKKLAGRSPTQIALLRLRQDKLAVVCGVIVAFLILVAIFAPVICKILDIYPTTETIPYEPFDMLDFSGTQLPNNGPPEHGFWAAHPLGLAPGTAVDNLARLLYGLRTSLLVATIATVCSILIGVVLGLVAGFSRGWLDRVIMFITDLFLSFPFILGALAMAPIIVEHFQTGNLSALGRVQLFALIAILTFFGWMGLCRLIRGQVLSLREREFVQAAQVMGVPTRRILFKELLPNLVAPIVVATSLSLPAYVTAEAGLSYLGIGITGIPSLGQTINDAQSYWEVYPLYLWAPVLTITVLVLALNLLGDSIRDAFDPRTRR